MSKESDKYLIQHTDAVTFLADGSATVEGHVHTSGYSLDEVRETMAEVSGVDPGSILLGDEVRARNKRSIGALGLRWNSPWEPTGGNPNLN